MPLKFWRARWPDGAEEWALGEGMRCGFGATRAAALAGWLRACVVLSPPVWWLRVRWARCWREQEEQQEQERKAGKR